MPSAVRPDLIVCNVDHYPILCVDSIDAAGMVTAPSQYCQPNIPNHNSNPVFWVSLLFLV